MPKFKFSKRSRIEPAPVKQTKRAVKRSTETEKREKKEKRKVASKTKSSTSVLTIEELRARGWCAGKVEYWQSFHGRKGGVRKDLFNCIDIVAVSQRAGAILGVQCTSRENALARVKKIQILASDRKSESGRAICDWLRVKGRLEVWGWDKFGGRHRLLEIRLRVTLDGKIVEASRAEFQAEDLLA